MIFKYSVLFPNVIWQHLGEWVLSRYNKKDLRILEINNEIIHHALVNS